MDKFNKVVKKYSLYFPHLPLPRIIESDKTFIVSIFNIELQIYSYAELDCLIDQVVSEIIKLHKNRQQIENNKPTKKASVEKSTKLISTYNNTQSNTKSNGKSARGKMRMKNIQNNRYIPSFSEDTNENKNNILTEPKELFSEKISNYCSTKNIAFPEYVFEKSNGVYFCKAFFMNEKFESRYAYDMKAAKEDACRLIISYINYLDSENIINKRKRSISEDEPTNTSVSNTNFSEIFKYSENEDFFDVGNFFTF
ncbi:hypothetical protein NCER_101038 [Vairimorpha ceranae BRL01]|uniref:DRBM domain-containing protein n=1 Tax=Vairimorpha ceranae (strain BRL01) TaxID=578460 RepID=C4V930_VAIC1|nr:hypothetical protein NCER_101038 [Vairimorpha ceranae BRL01]